MQYYVKKGKRYVPVNDPHAYEGLGKGIYLVAVRPGSTSIRTLLNPKFAELDAALDCLQEGLTKAIAKQSEMRPSSIPLTAREKKAWKAFDKIMGGEKTRLFAEFASYNEIAASGAAYIRKIMLENNCNIDKIKRKYGKKLRKLKNSIMELEI